MAKVIRDEQTWLPDLCTALAILRLILLGVLVTIMLFVLKYGLTDIRLSDVGHLFLYAVWIVLLSAAGLCWLRKLGDRLHMYLSTTLALLWVGLVASSCALFAFDFGDRALLPPGKTLLSIWAETLVVSLILGAVLFRFLYVHHQLQVQQKRLMQAQYDALQARIRPHFLFNSLNSIATMAALDAERTEAAILNLSDLLRATLKESSMVSLADELAICRKYLSIETLRMGERLQAEFEVDPALLKTPVPSLFLQPLLENAVLHGLQQRADGGLVHVGIRAVGAAEKTGRHRIQVQVRNPLSEKSTSSAGSGSALKNIRARFYTLCPEELVFEFGALADEYLVNIEFWSLPYDES